MGITAELLIILLLMILALEQTRRAMRTALCLIALTFTAGCAAVEARRGDGLPELYAGTRENVAQLREPSEEDRPLRRLMYLVDLPFSLVVDTLLVPVDFLRRSKAE